MYTLNCRGKLLTISDPLVMGIINCTPDSFHEGHLPLGIDAIIEMAGKMISEGASILDIGGQSTRPGSVRIGASEETDRVVPVINALSQNFAGTIISIDTYYSEVAQAAIDAGASIINDISSGGHDPSISKVASRNGAPYICMHMKGTPENMHEKPGYEKMIPEMLDFFSERICRYQQEGINDIIIDPGFGFSKTREQNFELLNHLAAFKILGKPVLAGLSRKSFIYKTLGTTPEHALNGTTALHMAALMNGANILRVHDVKAAVETVHLFLEMKREIS